MFRQLREIKLPIWYALIVTMVIAILPSLLQLYGSVSGMIAFSAVQPLLSLGAALLVHRMTNGRRDHLRHQSEKAG